MGKKIVWIIEKYLKNVKTFPKIVETHFNYYIIFIDYNVYIVLQIIVQNVTVSNTTIKITQVGMNLMI